MLKQVRGAENNIILVDALQIPRAFTMEPVNFILKLPTKGGLFQVILLESTLINVVS